MESSNLSDKIRKNIVGSLGIKLISVLVSLAYVPVLISYLGKEEYGIWIVISSTLAWINFFDIGLGNGLRNRLTEAISIANYERAKTLISTSYALLGGIFIAVAIAFVLTINLWNWNRILSLESISANELKLLIGMVAVSFCLRFIVQLIQPILFAIHKSALSSLFPVVSNIIGIILIYLIRYIDCPKLLTAAFIISVLPIVSFIIGTVFLFSKSLSFIQPSFKHIDFSVSKDILSLGFKFFFLQVATNLINTASSFIIIKILGPTYVTEYDVLLKYYMMALMVNEIVLAPLWSAFTEAFAKKDLVWAKKVLRKLNWFSLIQAIGILIMFFISDLVVKLWINKQFSISKNLSFALMVLITLRIFLSPFVRVINGSGKLMFSIIVNVLCCILFVVLAITLGKSSLGTVGVVISACIARAILLIANIVQVRHLLSLGSNKLLNS